MSGLCGLLQFGGCGISVVKLSSMHLSIYLHAGVGTGPYSARCLRLDFHGYSTVQANVLQSCLLSSLQNRIRYSYEVMTDIHEQLL